MSPDDDRTIMVALIRSQHRAIMAQVKALTIENRTQHIEFTGKLDSFDVRIRELETSTMQSSDLRDDIKTVSNRVDKWDELRYMIVGGITLLGFIVMNAVGYFWSKR